MSHTENYHTGGTQIGLVNTLQGAKKESQGKGKSEARKEVIENKREL